MPTAKDPAVYFESPDGGAATTDPHLCADANDQGRNVRLRSSHLTNEREQSETGVSTDHGIKAINTATTSHEMKGSIHS